MISVTQKSELHKVYSHLNKCLFSGMLTEDIYLQLAYSIQTEGLFIHDKHDNKRTGETRHNITIDENLLNEPNNYWLIVLVHQMIHLWQFQYGKQVPAKHYHNKEYVKKALEIGIIIQQSESNEQEIKEDSLIIYAINNLPEVNLLLPRNVSSQLNSSSKNGKKYTFTCPNCNSRVFAKYDSLDICGVCHQTTGEIIYRVRQDK